MKILAAASLLMLGGCASFAPPRPPLDPLVRLRNDIDAILADSIFLSTRASVEVASLKSGRILYARENKLLGHPASNLKLFTSASALHFLGHDFRFVTSVFADSLTPGNLYGNLYIKGYGDPNLTGFDLDSLASAVHAAGIRQIIGDVVADVSYFDDNYWGNGWMWDDEPDPDEMYISALSVNKNCVTVNVLPTPAASDSVVVFIDPPTPYVTVRCSAKTVDDTLKHTLNISRLFKDRLNTVTVDGEIQKSADVYRERLSVWRPELYAAELFKESLERDSVAVVGLVRSGIAPGNAVKLTEYRRPLDSVVIAMNKISDNLSAENLLKTIGARVRGLPGSAANGVYAENEFLSSLGIDTTGWRIVDGSGVSHYNLVTAEQLVELLAYVSQRPEIFPTFYASLPVAGVDGTLQYRMAGTAAAGNLRAKTGTLSGVSTISGYVTTRDGELLAFSVMMQNSILPASFYQTAQDRIGVLLAEFSRKPPVAVSR